MTKRESNKIRLIKYYIESKARQGISAEYWWRWERTDDNQYIYTLYVDWVYAIIWSEVMSPEILRIFPEVTFKIRTLAKGTFVTVEIVTPVEL